MVDAALYSANVSRPNFGDGFFASVTRARTVAAETPHDKKVPASSSFHCLKKWPLTRVCAPRRQTIVARHARKIPQRLRKTVLRLPARVAFIRHAAAREKTGAAHRSHAGAENIN